MTESIISKVISGLRIAILDCLIHKFTSMYTCATANLSKDCITDFNAQLWLSASLFVVCKS